MNSSSIVVLGSQSLQRRSLLQTLLPETRIEIVPPLQSEEAGFEGLNHITEIEQRLKEISATKNADVQEQCVTRKWGTILTADTVVVVGGADSATVLGKPDGPDWEATVENWFTEFYSAQTHQVMTAVSFSFPMGETETVLASTTVHFRKVTPALLNWYIQTGEPLGKAGGYGIQSGGSLFVESIHGSLTNVIGLPLENVWDVLQSHGLI